MSSSFWIRLGALLGGLAVALGALAAHGLEGYLEQLYAGQTRELLGHQIPAAEKYLGDFKTAATYQMYHALAILVVGLLVDRCTCRNLQWAGWCFVAGTLLFSGCLYLLVLTGQRWLGMIVPIGGVLMIVGWILLAVASIRQTNERCVPADQA